MARHVTHMALFASNVAYCNIGLYRDWLPPNKGSFEKHTQSTKNTKNGPALV